jgi:hypothetical protein
VTSGPVVIDVSVVVEDLCACSKRASAGGPVQVDRVNRYARSAQQHRQMAKAIR